MSNDESVERIMENIEMLKNRLDQLQDVVPESTDDYHRLFLYFIGEQFEGISPDKIKICDRKADQKIDFYYVGEDSFIAYQCKLPDLELLEQKKKVETFTADLINEAEDILTFLTDTNGTAKGNKEAQEARSRYHSKKEIAADVGSNYKLEVAIAYFGRLTTPAKERLEELHKSWSGDNGDFEIKTIDYDNIASELSLSLVAFARPKDMRLDFRPGTKVDTNEWGYALVPAIQFYDLFDKYKMALFDLNVRYYLERSSVNRQIINTLREAKGQKRFHLLNNGITISCTGRHFSKREDENWVKLFRPQIINGCQTVISIYRAYNNEIDNEYNRRHFKENCFVPVRMIITQDLDLLADVVTASNFQNKMSPRNLRSNSRVQRVLQRKFDQLEHRWFYERKDGEFTSSKEYAPRGFKIRNYEYFKNRYRVVSNEIIAKSWLSFIGFSTDASEKINAFDFDDEGGRYEWLFEKKPSAKHWNAITLGPQVELDEENFESFSPIPEQYLLSYLIFELVKAYLPTPQENKKDCLKRLTQSGKINDNSPQEDISKAMMEDDIYVLNQILYNMKEVIVELYAWIFIKTYGSLNEITSKKILRLPDFSNLCFNPDFKSFVKNLSDEDLQEKNVLWCCFEFIKEGVNRWRSVYSHEYFSSQRRIRFLHSAKTVEQMKNYLNEANKSTKKYGYDWKPPHVMFLESLPTLGE